MTALGTDTFRLVVTVGSDHHPFDRLVRWVDAWLDRRREHPAPAVDAFVQYGTGTAARAPGTAFLDHSALLDLVRAADLVVMQGGPTGIVEACRAGRRPLVVPRLQRLGEVVDDHQVAFCRHLAQLGDIRLAEDEAGLHQAMDEALAQPGWGLLAAGAATITGGAGRSVTAFAAIADGLLARHPAPARKGAVREVKGFSIPRPGGTHAQ